jgi:hypothetical protein
MDESQLESQLNDLQTDENELDEVLAKYDLDEALEAEFNDLENRFRNLQLHYQTLLNTRKYLINARPTLSTARKKSAKTVANKLAKKAPKSPSVPAPSSSAPSVATFTQQSQHPQTAPLTTLAFHPLFLELVGITPDAIAGMMPSYDLAAFQIVDRLIPPESYPKQQKLRLTRV